MKLHTNIQWPTDHNNPISFVFRLTTTIGATTQTPSFSFSSLTQTNQQTAPNSRENPFICWPNKPHQSSKPNPKKNPSTHSLFRHQIRDRWSLLTSSIFIDWSRKLHLPLLSRHTHKNQTKPLFLSSLSGEIVTGNNTNELPISFPFSARDFFDFLFCFAGIPASCEL